MKYALPIAVLLHVGLWWVGTRVGPDPVVSFQPVWVTRSAGIAPSSPTHSRRRAGGPATLTAPLPPTAGPVSPATGSVAQWMAWGNPPPPYPLEAEQKGWQGRVELRVVAAGDNESPRSVTLVRSSGHALLDSTAKEWVEHCRIRSANEGVREFLLPVEFRLE